MFQSKALVTMKILLRTNNPKYLFFIEKKANRRTPKFAKEKLQGISRSIAEILPQLSAGNYQILSLFSRLSGDQEKISNKSQSYETRCFSPSWPFRAITTCQSVLLFKAENERNRLSFRQPQQNLPNLTPFLWVNEAMNKLNGEYTYCSLLSSRKSLHFQLIFMAYFYPLSALAKEICSTHVSGS